MASNEETNLIRELQQQNRNAQRKLYQQYAGKLHAVCMHYIGHREDCKDVLQDIFIRIFTSVASFEYRGEGSLEAWINRIAIHECLSFSRGGFPCRYNPAYSTHCRTKTCPHTGRTDSKHFGNNSTAKAPAYSSSFTTI